MRPGAATAHAPLRHIGTCGRGLSRRRRPTQKPSGRRKCPSTPSGTETLRTCILVKCEPIEERCDQRDAVVKF
ncbi:Hypothetical protein NTJ_13073 [Nesidiocoris tenuis]|uniref:Uncharacterized protein n=1 Tax=Nesidiocoris tenuis TaxID=355587 RepID=A0ABN7B9F9_9HEMI|nr:Hypothetical protein NTJ_13073 [Nesidiocoris tenuis]